MARLFGVVVVTSCGYGARMSAKIDVVLPLTDRAEAGRLLGEAVRALDLDDPVVTGLPRGGVPVAAEVAYALDAPLDVIIVRKLGTPGHAELAMGALGEGGVVVRNERVISVARPSEEEIQRAIDAEEREVSDRAQRFRAGRPPHPLRDRTVVIVDDGLATGSTAEAAVQVARGHGARRVVVAVPVGSDEAVQRLSAQADDVLCLAVPDSFGAVGAFYRHFDQTTEDAVLRLLDAAAERASSPDVAASAERSWTPRGRPTTTLPASLPSSRHEIAVDVGPPNTCATCPPPPIEISGSSAPAPVAAPPWSPPPAGPNWSRRSSPGVVAPTSPGTLSDGWRHPPC